MKKIILILPWFVLFYSCKFEEEKAYEEETFIKIDSLDIEQIKIETH
jgi:hypothetical protein